MLTTANMAVRIRAPSITESANNPARYFFHLDRLLKLPELVHVANGRFIVNDMDDENPPLPPPRRVVCAFAK